MGKNGSVRSVVPRIEDIEEAVRGFFDYGSVPGLKVPLTKKPFKGNKKAHVWLEEARALKVKATHVKIGWVSCRVRKKGGKPVLPLPWFRPYDVRLRGAW